MRGPWYLPLAVAAVVAGPSWAGAQQVRAGAEFRGNTYTTGVQRRPAIHVKKNGEFIVSWTGQNTTLDGSAYGTFAQRYAANGVAQGAEFRVNTFTQSYQFRPAVASDKAGNFVVAWSSYNQDGSYYGMFGQRFAANGAPVGGEFMVNTFTAGGQGSSFYFLENNHDVAMAANGDFVVVWGSYGANQDGSYSSVHGQRFAANGTRRGSEFQINTITTGYQFSPSVSIKADNSFVVVWSTEDGSGYGVAGQLFDASGAKVGAEFLVPDVTGGDQQAAAVRARPTGEFIVTWTDQNGTQDIFARRFSATGTPVGLQFVVNTPAGGIQYAYNFGMDVRGNFVVNWNNHNDGGGYGIGGRRFRNDGTPREADSTVNLVTVNLQEEASVDSDEVGNVFSAWVDNGRDGSFQGVFAQRFGGLRPAGLAVDSAGNGVIEPSETADVRPSWLNINGAAQTFGGTLSNLTGPAGGTYTITDATASYGTVANNAVGTCTDCYGVTIGGTRPAQHWDASAVETITPDTQGQQRDWRLHVGASFSDVSTSSPFYRFIETLLHHDVTGGCGGTAYCPGANTTREQMAVFVLVAKEGAGYFPQACGATPTFADVPATSPFCRFIEELARRGVVSGCGGGNYCPTSNVTRQEMAIFVLVTLDPTLNPPACGTPAFADVPASSPFCRWIEELARRAIVTGCGGGNYCPVSPVTREQMGVFISVTFGLTLYGL